MIGFRRYRTRAESVGSMHARSADRTAERVACPIGVFCRASCGNGIPGRHQRAHHGLRRAGPQLPGPQTGGPGSGGTAGGDDARRRSATASKPKATTAGTQADSAGFVVAYPDGDGAWNGRGCCGEADRENIDDVAFITTMVGQISDDLPSTRPACTRPESATAAS